MKGGKGRELSFLNDENLTLVGLIKMKSRNNNFNSAMAAFQPLLSHNFKNGGHKPFQEECFKN